MDLFNYLSLMTCKYNIKKNENYFMKNPIYN